MMSVTELDRLLPRYKLLRNVRGAHHTIAYPDQETGKKGRTEYTDS